MSSRTSGRAKNISFVSSRRMRLQAHACTVREDFLYERRNCPVADAASRQDCVTAGRLPGAMRAASARHTYRVLLNPAFPASGREEVVPAWLCLQHRACRQQLRTRADGEDQPDLAPA